MAELAEETGVAPRTIRYYISRGLLPGPDQAGRGATYGRAHADRILEIVRRQRAGSTLAEIAIVPLARERVQLEAAPWWKFDVSSDVVVEVRAGLAPWRMKVIRAAIEDLQRKLDQKEK